ncbi:MAG TPA: sulfite exporter TauE/SafE family protein [Acidimicrobiales bacterium]|nr:sulfite exporter TauE/SafE family protein [Acidimicrobiales bacterium]
MSPTDIAVIFAVMTIGAVIQGAVGFGANLVAAPALVLIDPELVPGPVLVAGLALNALMVLREPEHDGLRSTGWALVGRVPGTALGAAALVALPSDRLAVLFPVLILVGVGLSVGGFRVRRTAPTLVGAGTLSGFMATVVGIGGPPMALAYQDATGPVLRGALARFFTIGGILSVVSLVVVGRFGLDALLTSLILVPGVVLGFVLSRHLNRVLDGGWTRVAVLAVSAASAIVALARAV